MRRILAFIPILCLSAFAQDADFRRQVRSSQFTREMLEKTTAQQVRDLLNVTDSVGLAPVKENLAALAAHTGGTNGQTFYVQGYTTRGDWGQPKAYTLDTSSAVSTNMVAIANAGDDGGRWVHPWNGDLSAFGILPDSDDDISLSLSNALVAANGKRVWFQRGSYKSGELIYTNGSVWIDGQGATVRPELTGFSWDFRNPAIIEANVLTIETNLVNLHTDGLSTKATRVLTANLDTGITLGRGDLVFLYSNDRIPGGHQYSATTAGRIGEWFTVGLSITNFTEVNFNRMPVEDYQTLIRIAVPNQTNRLRVENIVWDEQDETSPTGTGRTAFVAATGYLYPRFQNLEVERSYGSSFTFRCCYGGSMDTIQGRRLNNLSAYGQFGYMVLDRGSFGCSYSNLRGHVFRHLQATTATSVEDGDTLAPWYYHGTSMFGIVRDSVGHAGSNSAFETHENAYGWLFSNLHAIGGFDGNNAGGPGISFRGRNHRLVNSVIENCNVGLFLWSGYSNDVRNIEVDGVRVINAVDAAFTAYCASGAYSLNNITVRNSYFQQRGDPDLSQAFYGINVTSVSNLFFKDCEFDITTPRNGAVLLASVAADRQPTVSRFENCKWTINAGDERPFLIQGGNHTFINNEFRFTGPVPAGLEAMKVGPSYGTNAVVTLKDCTFDVTGSTTDAHIFTIDTEGDVLVGENVNIVTGGDASAIGWIWNAIGASAYSPRIGFTNVWLDVDINTAWTDSLFGLENIMVDVSTPTDSGRFPTVTDSAQLSWPASYVNLGTLSADATLYLPKASRYKMGDRLVLANVGSRAYKWTVKTNSLWSTDTINGGSTTTLEFDIPGEKSELVSDGVSNWTVLNPRARTIRDFTAGSGSFFSYTDGYSVTANANPTLVTLPSAVAYQQARLLFGTKVGGPYELHFIPTSGQTINGATNAIVLTDAGDAVIFKADPKEGVRTNWIVVGSHGLP